MGWRSPWRHEGWEHAESIDPRELALTATRQALVKLGAAPPERHPAGHHGERLWRRHLPRGVRPPAGDHPVAKKASVFHDKMGQLIANPAVSAVDEGLQGNAWGSINVDDEGWRPSTPSSSRTGADRLPGGQNGAIRTGYARTGSGRRESYKFAPGLPHAQHLYRTGQPQPGRDAGNRGARHRPSGWGGWVQPGTGEFNFNVQEAYLIEGGKINWPLKSATLIGTGPQVIPGAEPFRPWWGRDPAPLRRHEGG